MKNIRIAGLLKCPVCGSRAILRKNSAKSFQVTCSKCEYKTGWHRKVDAVILWYNGALQYWRNTGILHDQARKG